MYNLLNLPPSQFLADLEAIRLDPPTSTPVPFMPPHHKTVGPSILPVPVTITTPPKIQPVDTPEVIADIALLPFGLIGQGAVIARGLTGDEPMTPTQFGATQTAALFGLPGAIVSTEGLLQAQEVGVEGVAPPGVEIFPPVVTNILEGRGFGDIELKLPGLPDLSGLKKYAILAGIGMAGVYLAGQLLKR